MSNILVLIVFPAFMDVDLGGFLMARFRRGLDTPKIYPVVYGYAPENQPPFPQHTGVIPATKN